MCDTFDEDKNTLKSIGIFLMKVTMDDEDVKKIVQKMDKVDGIKALNSKSSNEKRVETWLKRLIMSIFMALFQFQEIIYWHL